MAVIGREAARAPLTSADINDGIVGAADLQSTLDLSSKTITMPSISSLDVTGTITADGLTVETNSGGILTLNNTTTSISDDTLSGKLVFSTDDPSGANADVELKAVADSFGKQIFYVRTGRGDVSGPLDRLSVDFNGDIAFYEDTGTTPKFFWDASAESLGIGTSSPSGVIHVQGDSNDLSVAVFGASDTNEQLTLGSFDANNTNGIPSLLRTSDFGGIIQGGTNGNLVLGIRDNDATDGVVILSGGGNFMTDSTYDTVVATFKANGNVGIGEQSPSSKLHVKGGDGNHIRYEGATHTVGMGIIGTDPYVGSLTNGPLLFLINGSERARLDQSGNLLVGTTSTPIDIVNTSTESGLAYDADDFLVIARSGTSGQACLILNKITDDGEIIGLRKDGAEVGTISTIGSAVYLGTGNTKLLFRDASNDIRPVVSGGTNRDDVTDLGASSARFDNIYATNGTIQTSDANEKQDIAELDEAERRVAVAAKGLLRKFRWKSAVAEKGDEARIHFGIIAQDLQAAFEAEGLDAGRYGMFIHSTWTDEETGEERSRMGVRYSELLAFIIAAL